MKTTPDSSRRGQRWRRLAGAAGAFLLLAALAIVPLVVEAAEDKRRSRSMELLRARQAPLEAYRLHLGAPATEYQDGDLWCEEHLLAFGTTARACAGSHREPAVAELEHACSDSLPRIAWFYYSRFLRRHWSAATG